MSRDVVRVAIDPIADAFFSAWHVMRALGPGAELAQARRSVGTLFVCIHQIPLRSPSRIDATATRLANRSKS